MLQRAFISAPLLGTLIFLGAVVFIVHVTQAEKAEVSDIVADVYHNRIITMLEGYRYDMGSLFAVSLSRAIEKYLSRECWEVFEIKNKNTHEPLGTTFGTPPQGFPEGQQINFDNLPFCLNLGQTPNGYCTQNRFEDHEGRIKDAVPVSPFSDYRPVCGENCNGQLDYHELRYFKCAQITDIIRTGVCPYDTEFGLSAWLESTTEPFSFEGVSFSLSNKELVESTVSRLSCCFDSSFIGGTCNKLLSGDEGKYFDVPQAVPQSGGECVMRDLSPAEKQKCKLADGSNCPAPGTAGKLIIGGNIDYCRRLIGQSLFDCRNFAENLNFPFRCCDKFYYNPSNPSDVNNGRCCDGFAGQELGCINPDGSGDKTERVIEGCEAGSFFIKVRVLTGGQTQQERDEVFKRLPRVHASDKAGNQIQSGALGDRDFFVHVKYPAYKYLDAAFRMYAPIAYGVGSGDYDFKAPFVNMYKHRGRGRVLEETTGWGFESKLVDKPGGKEKQGDAEGVIEGICYGKKENCALVGAGPGATPDPAKKYDRGKWEVSNPDRFKGDAQKAQAEAVNNFLNTFFEAQDKSVCRLFKRSAQGGVCDKAPFDLCDTEVYLSRGGLPSEMLVCSGSTDPAKQNEITQNLNQIRTRAINVNFLDFAKICGDPDKQEFCVVADKFALQVKFVDRKPETLVNPISNNFCWHLRPEHLNPEIKVGETAGPVVPPPVACGGFNEPCCDPPQQPRTKADGCVVGLTCQFYQFDNRCR